MDRLLTLGLDYYRRGLCSDGCGAWYADCINPDLVERWDVVLETNYAHAARERFMKDEGSGLEPGALVGVRLLAEGEEPSVPLSFDPDRAAAEAAAHAERMKNL